jgi:hypothetical protein
MQREIHYRVHDNPPLAPGLSEINPFYDLAPFF